MFNPFDVFGLPINATAQVIRARYAQLLKKLHPDTVSQGPVEEEALQGIMNAYTILKDDFLRGIFVQSVDSGLSFSHEEEFRAFASRFAQKPPEPAQSGRKEMVSVTLSLEESLLGAQKKIICAKVPVFITIPPNTVDHSTVRYKHQESVDSFVDIDVTVFVAPHPFLHREGSNLVCACPLSFAEAVSGAAVLIPTPYEIVSVWIPAFSQKTPVSVAGKGVQGAQCGDLIVVPNIVPPPKDSPLVHSVAAAEQAHPYDPRGVFSQKVHKE